MKIFSILLLVFFTFISNSLFSQIISNEYLMGVPRGSTTEILALAGKEGDLAYSTTTKNLMLHDGTKWVELKTSDASGGSSAVFGGHFIINKTGSLTVSDLNFTPSFITFDAYANIVSTNLDSGVGVARSNSPTLNFGAMNGYARKNANNTITQQTISLARNIESDEEFSRYANTSTCIGLRYAGRNDVASDYLSASLTSFNTNGFTINVTNIPDNLVLNTIDRATVIFYVAYK